MRQEFVYVLRLWRDGAHPEGWRASVENLRSKEKIYFPSFRDLYRFLDEQRDVKPKDGGEEPG